MAEHLSHPRPHFFRSNERPINEADVSNNVVILVGLRFVIFLKERGHFKLNALTFVLDLLLLDADALRNGSGLSFLGSLSAESLLAGVIAGCTTTNGTQEGSNRVSCATHTADGTSDTTKDILIALEPIQGLVLQLLIRANTRRCQTRFRGGAYGCFRALAGSKPRWRVRHKRRRNRRPSFVCIWTASNRLSRLNGILPTGIVIASHDIHAVIHRVASDGLRLISRGKVIGIWSLFRSFRAQVRNDFIDGAGR